MVRRRRGSRREDGRTAGQQRGGALVSDVAYLLLVLGGFVLLAATLRGLQRL
jgi:hypothetical protein